MTLQIALLLSIVAAAVVLFSLEHLPVDVIALGITMTLILTGLLPADQAFLGFGSNTVVMIFGLLVLTAALINTGVIDLAGRWLLRLTGDNPDRLLGITMIVAATLSAFISNTATTAMFVPLTLSLARRTKTDPSKLLMPLAFASILASSVTLISSSTNLIVSDLMTNYDMPPLGLLRTHRRRPAHRRRRRAVHALHRLPPDPESQRAQRFGDCPLACGHTWRKSSYCPIPPSSAKPWPKVAWVAIWT